MKNLNESLLESIDLIQESAADAELDVLFAMGEAYTKAGMLMEYADEDVLKEFSFFQESAFFMEEDAPADDKKDDKKDGEKKPIAIVRFLRWIKNIFVKFFEKAVEKFKKLGEKIKAAFSKEVTDAEGNTFSKVDLKEFEAALNDNLKTAMKTGLNGNVTNEVDKLYRSIKPIYESAKKKIFKFNGTELMYLVPFFTDGFKKAFESIIKKNKDNKASFDMKKLADFDYVKSEDAAEAVKKDGAEVVAYIDKLIADASNGGDASNYSHIQAQASGFQQYALKTTLAYIDVLSKTVTYTLGKVNATKDVDNQPKKEETKSE